MAGGYAVEATTTCSAFGEGKDFIGIRVLDERTTTSENFLRSFFVHEPRGRAVTALLVRLARVAILS
jgi:hypothetical protein